MNSKVRDMMRLKNEEARLLEHLRLTRINTDMVYVEAGTPITHLGTALFERMLAADSAKELARRIDEMSPSGKLTLYHRGIVPYSGKLSIVCSLWCDLENSDVLLNERRSKIGKYGITEAHRARVQAIIARELGHSVDKVVDHANFVTDLDADSLDIVELLIQIEKEFKLRIDDSFMQCKTPSEAYSFLSPYLEGTP